MRGHIRLSARAADASSDHATPGFPIVGIGASAGGFEAFTRLLQNLPADTGMAFVLVQHLDPGHASALTQLLSKATSLPVREIADNLPVAPNQVYVIPPNKNLGIAQGVLKLEPRPAGRGAHRSIDHFFESLAQDQRECAVGVILSGTASDGTMGLEAIKAEGGVTFAQDETAKYDSMPRSAIAAGCVDFVLPPDKIAQELAWIARHPLVGGGAQSGRGSKKSPRPSDGAVVSGDHDGFRSILVLLRKHTGVDFSLYKTKTLERRIHRRMVLNKLTTLDAYAHFLRSESAELDSLYLDVLISVTSFFRNPEAFAFLQRKVFPRILAGTRDEPLRVWVLGCSTGQEAYSLAMAFTEFLDRVPHAPKLQIFATDLNEAVLVKARAGLYAKSLVQDVSRERLRRFFVEEDGCYRVIKPLRDAIVFARQNILSDPPFSRVAMISCRNLLIYIEPGLQKRIIPTFHYALKPNGCLFLGASETVGAFTDLFEPADKKHKVYFKKTGPSPAQHLQRAPREAGAENLPAPSKFPAAPEEFRITPHAQREADRVTRNRYAPPGVLVNASLHILDFRGDTSRYLKSPVGQAPFNLLKMAGEGLMLPLSAALKKAKKENKAMRRENVRLKHNGQTRTINFDVVPLKNLKERCHLIFFEEADATGRAPPGAPPPKPPAKEESRRITALEAELAETRDYLQSVEEEHEASDEEVQAANEEVTSANEELQSVNEELETSKEELESANEELTTVNEEMANRNAELSRLNNDLVNFQTSTQLIIVLLGRDLTIRRFSAQAAKQFNLQASDVGRPISGVRHNLVFPERNRQPASDSAKSPDNLEAFIAGVVDTVREQEGEVRDQDGRWYALRVRPYMTLDNRVDGAVLVLVDIDARKRIEQTITAARDYAESILQTTREPLLVLDSDLRVERANGSFYRAFQVAPAATVGRSIFELGDRQWDIPRLRTLLNEVLPKHREIENFEVEGDFEKLGVRSMILSARRIDDPSWKTHRILLAIDDITQRKKLQQEIQNASVAEAVIRTAHDPLLILEADLRVHAANTAFYKTFRVSPAETEGCLLYDLSNHPWNTPKLRQLMGAILPQNSSFDNFELTHDFERIGRRTVLLNARKLDDAESRPTRILLGIQDITERKQMELALVRLYADEQQARGVAELANKTKDRFLAVLSHELRTPLTPVIAILSSMKEDGAIPEALAGDLEVVRRNIGLEARLIDDLLDLTRIASEKMELHLEHCEINQLLENAVNICMAELRAKNLVLVRELETIRETIVVDGVRLTQVFWNVLNNSIKFTPAGGTITVRSAVKAADKSKLIVIEIQDTGAGLESEQMDRLFNAFEQGGRDITHKFGGLGLGLAISRGIVELHGGTITAASPGKGCGSTFAIALPFDDSKLPTDAGGKTQALPTLPAGATTEARKLRILLVEDHADTAIILSRLLRRMGHYVVHASTAHDALETAGSEVAADGIDVVMSDLGLPDGSGLELMRVLSSKFGLRGIALSGFAMDFDIEQSKEAGFIRHLTKPIDIQVLRQTVAEIGHELGKGSSP